MPSILRVAASAALLVALSAGGARAGAYLLAVAPENYATVAEARAHITALPPAVCGAATPAARRCVTTFGAEDDARFPGVVRWRFLGWWPAEEVVCRDAATADHDRSCDDPLAVPEPAEYVLPPPIVAVPPAPAGKP